MLARFSKLLSWWPVEKAIYVACVVGLITLALMAAGIIWPYPLPVVASMSIAQGLGVLAGLIFAISIAADAGAHARRK